jgi:hypothetical protein
MHGCFLSGLSRDPGAHGDIARQEGMAAQARARTPIQFERKIDFLVV